MKDKNDIEGIKIGEKLRITWMKIARDELVDHQYRLSLDYETRERQRKDLSEKRIIYDP